MILPAFGIISEIIAVHSPQAHLRLQGHRHLLGRHRHHQLPRLGPPHVHRPVGLRGRLLFSF
jgi:hypothetical protein